MESIEEETELSIGVGCIEADHNPFVCKETQTLMTRFLQINCVVKLCNNNDKAVPTCGQSRCNHTYKWYDMIYNTLVPNVICLMERAECDLHADKTSRPYNGFHKLRQ